ncbi:MAG: hypothetical protein K1X74_04695 [Pirellulales bacterium]|nr:hypothetical protein [Pirellulales bacterium]
MLTEQEVSRSWHKLFQGGAASLEKFERAEALLEELRAESPLRHRLSTELDEIRRIFAAKNGDAEKPAKPKRSRKVAAAQ